MMKFFLTIMTALVVTATGALAQEQEVSFYNGTLSEALALAKKENKKVFLDVYTTWCAPCKKMTKEVFPVKKVGDFYNANFVSLKIDAEKGEGIAIAKQYNVGGYPSLIYLNSEGKVIQKVTNYLDVDAFYMAGEEVVSGKDNTEALEKKYNDGAISHEELYAYMLSLKGKELHKKAEEVFEKYFRVQVTKEITPLLLDQISRYVSSSDNAPFQYLVNNRKAFYEKIEKKKVDEMIQAFYLDEFRFLKAFKSIDEFKEERQKLSKLIAMDEELSLSLENGFYYDKKLEDEYMESARLLMEKYYDKDHEEISVITGSGLRIGTKEETFKTLIVWAEKAIALKENSVNVGTLGALYAKLKDKETAIKYFDKSIEISKRDKDNYVQNIEYLKQFYLSEIKE